MEPALLWPLGYFHSESTPGMNFNISLKDTCLKTHTQLPNKLLKEACHAQSGSPRSYLWMSVKSLNRSFIKQ